MIEKNSVSPSISSLKKVLAGIPKWFTKRANWSICPVARSP
jgi:hypothetical protein